MSGTSLDGVDVAFLETDGEDALHFGPSLVLPYAPDEVALLRASLEEGRNLAGAHQRTPLLREAEVRLTCKHAEAVEALWREYPETRARTQLIGFHGQTVLHAPERSLTVQLGDAAMLAASLKLPVAYDFRSADVAAGGQGAPLVPIYHQALLAQSSVELPAAVINIGGVANLTFCGADGELIAFDTGPGNALINDCIFSRKGQAYDDEGALAAKGIVDEARVRGWLSSSYFLRKYPKSLDRNAFSDFNASDLSLEDALATLVELTVQSISAGLALLPQKPLSLMIVGGGAHNRTIMHRLSALTQMPVKTGAEMGWDNDALEAQAFAYLAVRTQRGLPISFPLTTGAPSPLCGGRVIPYFHSGRSVAGALF